MSEPTRLTEDEYEAQYRPLDNEDDVLTWEFDQIQDIPPNRVWTVVEGDDEGFLYVQNGLHRVNVFGYHVTEVPWPDGAEIEVTYDLREQ
jgi:hypothetical protein